MNNVADAIASKAVTAKNTMSHQHSDDDINNNSSRRSAMNSTMPSMSTRIKDSGDTSELLAPINDTNACLDASTFVDLNNPR
jgi:hypothetical protein